MIIAHYVIGAARDFLYGATVLSVVTALATLPRPWQRHREAAWHLDADGYLIQAQREGKHRS